MDGNLKYPYNQLMEFLVFLADRKHIKAQFLRNSFCLIAMEPGKGETPFILDVDPPVSVQ